MGAIRFCLCTVMAVCALAIAPLARAEPSPMRIVSLSGSLTEIVAELGFADRLVGVDRSSLRPPELVRRLPKVGSPRSVSIESVLAVSPTMVIAYDDMQPTETLAKLGDLGVVVILVMRRSSVESAREKVLRVAEGLGVPEKGQALVAAIDRDLAWPSGKPKPDRRLRALFIQTMGNGPLMVAGGNTAAEALMAVAEVDNAVHGFEAYRPLNPEAAAAANPDVIIILRRALERVGGEEGLAAMPGLGEPPAICEHRIVIADDSAFIGLGPTTGASVRHLREAVYGR